MPFKISIIFRKIPYMFCNFSKIAVCRIQICTICRTKPYAVCRTKSPCQGLPSCASVITARAWICVVSFDGSVKLFAYMFTVMLPMVDKSGSCAAKALRCTGARAGIVVGISCTFALVISSLQSTSLSHCISSYCYVVSSSLLLILMGVIVQV
jgi:hypothetical protein